MPVVMAALVVPGVLAVLAAFMVPGNTLPTWHVRNRSKAPWPTLSSTIQAQVCRNVTTTYATIQRLCRSCHRPTFSPTPAVLICNGHLHPRLQRQHNPGPCRCRGLFPRHTHLSHKAFTPLDAACPCRRPLIWPIPQQHRQCHLGCPCRQSHLIRMPAVQTTQRPPQPLPLGTPTFTREVRFEASLTLWHLHPHSNWPYRRVSTWPMCKSLWTWRPFRSCRVSSRQLAAKPSPTTTNR